MSRPCYLDFYEIVLDEISIIINTEIPLILPEVKKNNNYHTTNVVILILFIINTYHTLSHPCIIDYF